MRLLKPILLLCAASMLSTLFVGCTTTDNSNSNATATTNVSPPTASPQPQTLTVVERPQKIKDLMAARGEQDQAKPTLKFIEPHDGQTINGSTVNLKLSLSGDLKGYKPMKDPATGTGNHIHVILDNQPYEAYYNLDQPFELRNVSEGKHTLRVFPSRPWHESFKNEGAFQMVEFTVKGGGDASKPTTTKDGQTMADPTKSPAKAEPSKAANANSSASPTPAREGKDFAPSKA